MSNIRTLFCLVFVMFSSWLQSDELLNKADIHSTWKVQVDVLIGSTDKGQAVLSVFDSEDKFLEEPIITLRKAENKNGVISFQLVDLSDQYYSVSVFFDEDKNGELNTNFFGIPSEPVGFSNNAKGRFGPPSFEQTRFKPSDKSSIEIRLITIGD